MIDLDRLEALRADADPDELKYLDHVTYCASARMRCIRAGLDKGPKRLVLDLGCGAGWFAYVAQKEFGHHVDGLDVPGRSKLFREITEMLGVVVIEREIKPFEKLRIVRNFDLATAFQITFNGHRQPPLWGPNEWGFFVGNLTSIADAFYLELNREPTGETITPAMRTVFGMIGATIADATVSFAGYGAR